MESNKEDKTKHEHTWRIGNFSMSTKKKGDALISPTFKAKCFSDTAWFIKFYPSGKSNSKDGWTSCFLIRREDDVVPLEIECDFIVEIVNKNGDKVLCNKSISAKFYKGKCDGWTNFMKTDELVRTGLYDDTLVIRCTMCGNTPEKNLHSQNGSVTKFRVKQHTFQWDVNILKSNTRQEVIKFPCSGSLQVDIAIAVTKAGDTDYEYSDSDAEDSDTDDDAYIKISISIRDHFSGSRFMLCNFTLLDVEGNDRFLKRATQLFENAGTWKFPNFIKKSQLMTKKSIYQKNNCFTLKCDFIVSDGSIDEREEHPLTVEFTNKDTSTVLSEDIRRLHVDKTLADLKLKVGEQIFSVHKCILYARSPVFFAMFNHDMAENQKGEVDIPDLDSKTMALFLEYVYTGTVNGLDCENAMKLIMVADKYQVLSLKGKCAELLASKLSDANVCEVLVIADLVRQDSLKAFTFDFIKKQPCKIFNSKEWKDCIVNNLELATETVCEVSRLWGDETRE